MLSSQRTEFVGAEMLDVAPARIRYDYCRVVGFEYRGPIDDKADADTLLAARQQQMEAIVAYCPEGGAETVIQSVQIDLDSGKVGSRQHLLTLTGYRNITHAALSAHGSNEEVILCYTEIVGGRTSYRGGSMSNASSSNNLASMVHNGSGGMGSGAAASSFGGPSGGVALNSAGPSVHPFDYSTNSDANILGGDSTRPGGASGGGARSGSQHPTFRITMHVVGTNLARDITPAPTGELSNQAKGYRANNICPRAYFLRQTKPRSQLYMLVSYDYVSLAVYKVGYKGSKGFEFEPSGGSGALAGRHLWHHWCPLTQRVAFWVYRNTYELRVMKISSTGGASASIFQMSDSRRARVDPIPFSPPPSPCLPWGSGNSSLNANFAITMVPIVYESSGERPMRDLAMCYQKLVSVLGRSGGGGGGGTATNASMAHTAHSGSHKVSIHCSILLTHNWLHNISLVFDVDISHVPVTASLRASFVFLDGLIAIIIPGVFVHFVDVAHYDQAPRYVFGLDLLAYRHAERERELRGSRAAAMAAVARGSGVMGDSGVFVNPSASSAVSSPAVPLTAPSPANRTSIGHAGGSSGSQQSLSSSAASPAGTILVGSIPNSATPTSPAGSSPFMADATNSAFSSGPGAHASMANARAIQPNANGFYSGNGGGASASATSPLTPQTGLSQQQQQQPSNVLSYVAAVFAEFSDQAHPIVPHRTGCWVLATDSTRLYRITLSKANLWRWIRDGTGGVERFGVHNAIHVASTHFDGTCSHASALRGNINALGSQNVQPSANASMASASAAAVVLCGEGGRYHSLPGADQSERFGIRAIADLLVDKHTAVTPSFLCQVLIGEAYADVRRTCRAKGNPYWPHIPMADDHGLAELEEIKSSQSRAVSAASDCPNRSWVRDACKRTDEGWWLSGEDLKKSTFFGLVKKKTSAPMHRFTLTGGIVRASKGPAYTDAIRRILLELEVPKEHAEFVAQTYTKALETIVRELLSIDHRGITPTKRLHFLFNVKVALLALDFPAPEAFERQYADLALQLMPPAAIYECVRGRLMAPDIRGLFKHYDCLQSKVNDAARDTGIPSQHLPIMSIGGYSDPNAQHLTSGGGGGGLLSEGLTAEAPRYVPPTEKEMAYALEGLGDLCPQLVSGDEFALDVTSSAAVASNGLTADEKHALIAVVQPEPLLQSYRRHFPLDTAFGKYLPLNLFVNSPMARESRFVAFNETELHVKRERAQLVMQEALYPMVVEPNRNPNNHRALSPQFRL